MVQGNVFGFVPKIAIGELALYEAKFKARCTMFLFEDPCLGKEAFVSKLTMGIG